MFPILYFTYLSLTCASIFYVSSLHFTYLTLPCASVFYVSILYFTYLTLPCASIYKIETKNIGTHGKVK